MKSVKFNINMNMANCILLFIILVLVIVCCMKKNTENFQQINWENSRKWGNSWVNGLARVEVAGHPLASPHRCWREGEESGLRTNKNIECVTNFTECLSPTSSTEGENIRWKNGIYVESKRGGRLLKQTEFPSAGRHRCWLRGGKGNVGLETNKRNRGCVRTFTGCLATPAIPPIGGDAFDVPTTTMTPAPTRVDLTLDLFRQGRAAYEHVTHIPEHFAYATKGFVGDVDLTDLQHLVSIGKYAFASYNGGKLTIAGNYPALVEIGMGAFGTMPGMSRPTSVVSLIALPNLVSIDDFAFYGFEGKVTIEGMFPALAKIGASAFEEASNRDSSVFIECNGGDLKVGDKAFENFGGPPPEYVGCSVVGEGVLALPTHLSSR
jgi:hypothetical protein